MLLLVHTPIYQKASSPWGKRERGTTTRRRSPILKPSPQGVSDVDGSTDDMDKICCWTIHHSSPSFTNKDPLAFHHDQLAQHHLSLSRTPHNVRSFSLFSFKTMVLKDKERRIWKLANFNQWNICWLVVGCWSFHLKSDLLLTIRKWERPWCRG